MRVIDSIEELHKFENELTYIGAKEGILTYTRCCGTCPANIFERFQSGMLGRKTFHDATGSNSAGVYKINLDLGGLNYRDFRNNPSTQLTVYLMDDLPKDKVAAAEEYILSIFKFLEIEVSIDKTYPYGAGIVVLNNIKLEINLSEEELACTSETPRAEFFFNKGLAENKQYNPIQDEKFKIISDSQFKEWVQSGMTLQEYKKKIFDEVNTSPSR